MSAAVATKKSVELFYDILSPYAWIGFEVLCRYQQKWDLDVKWSPVFFGGLLRNTDNVGPGRHPRKLAYIQKDIMRLARYYEMPFNKDYVGVFEPKVMPFFKGGNISAQRCLVSVSNLYPDYTRPLSSELFQRHWRTSKDLTKPESFIEAAIKVGLSQKKAEEVVGQIKDPAIKTQLIDKTQELGDLGGFGVPTLTATDKKGKQHMFFGSDRFHILAEILEEDYEGPLNELSTLK